MKPISVASSPVAILLLLAALGFGTVAVSPLAAQERNATDASRSSAGALEAYVAQPDASLQWRQRGEGELMGGQYVELTLTSQTWRGVAWKHQLFVYRPATVRDPSRSLLLIGGGAWRKELEVPDDGTRRLPREAVLVATVANQLAAPVAVVLQVPHQPLFGGMYEDEIIAYTFEQYLKTGDQTWPLLLPMVKSVVRAMDVVQEFAAERWQLKIERFTVTGASKRGWTTWLTAAVDHRVQCIAPMVIDVLNMAPQMEHQMRTWGSYSEQIADYTRRGLQQQLAAPEAGGLLEIVDPYSYRDRLTVPKLILLGTNDRYWPLDALNLYWPGLNGPKHVLYVPNNGHNLQDLARIAGTVVALHRQAAGELKLAELRWDIDNSDSRLVVRVRSDVRPARVAAWTASSPTRDFRDAHWASQPIEPSDGVYHCELPLPKTGFAAIFGEATYDGRGLPYYLSTNVKIVGSEAQPSEAAPATSGR